MRKEQAESILVSYQDIDTEVRYIIELENLMKKSYNCVEMPAEVEYEIRELNKKKNRMLNIKTDIIECLEELETKEKVIVFSFYILKKSWNKIAEEVHYSPRQCMNIRNAALEQLTEIFERTNNLKMIV